MRALVLTLAAAALVATVTASGAAANGSPYSPGLVQGWDGVLAPDRATRYVAIPTERSTVVAAVRADGGRILRWQSFKGFLGIPLVAYDGTSGGLSGDGKRLVVSSYGPGRPGAAGTTRFIVLDTKTLRTKRVAVLDGTWSFDAIAPDGSILYLTQHLRAGANPLYRVRSYDVRTGLLRGPVVDRIEGAEDMGGEPVTRATSRDGRWAYTLYARAKHEPFIHALDTAEREAFCIGLPLDLSRDEQWQLRLKLRERSGRLSVHKGATMLARVDTRSWKVSGAES
jgi:hypothetical protein